MVLPKFETVSFQPGCFLKTLFLVLVTTRIQTLSHFSKIFALDAIPGLVLLKQHHRCPEPLEHYTYKAALASQEEVQSRFSGRFFSSGNQFAVLKNPKAINCFVLWIFCPKRDFSCKTIFLLPPSIYRRPISFRHDVGKHTHYHGVLYGLSSAYQQVIQFSYITLHS